MSNHSSENKPGHWSQTGDFTFIQTQTGWQRTLLSFVDWCAPEVGWRVLDVGCGPGIFPAMLSSRGCRAFGVDLDPNAFLPEPLHADVAIADAVRLPFPDNSFDLVTASNLLFLVPNPVQVLREWARLLLPSGQVALLNPSEKLNRSSAMALAEARGLDLRARETLLHWAQLAELHARWDQDALERLLNAAGFKFVETRLRIGPGLARFARGIPLLMDSKNESQSPKRGYNVKGAGSGSL
jgi:SAM-dependent methyltransferase